MRFIAHRHRAGMDHDESTAACAAADVAARLVFERRRAKAELRAAEIELELLRHSGDACGEQAATLRRQVVLQRCESDALEFAQHAIPQQGGRHALRA